MINEIDEAVDELLINTEGLLNNKKFLHIPPLFYQDKYVTGFKEKAELFNFFLSKQSSIIQNSSKLS